MDITSEVPHHVFSSLTIRCKFIFQQLPDVRNMLLPCLKYCIVEPGTKIVSEGCTGEHMFIVFSGMCYAYSGGVENFGKPGTVVESSEAVECHSTEEATQSGVLQNDSESVDGAGCSQMEGDCDKLTFVESIPEGECFGENALIGRTKKYLSTVLAAVHVELLVLDSGSFQKVFGELSLATVPWLSEMYRPALKRPCHERSEEDINSLADLLDHVKLFKDCSVAAKRQLAHKVLYHSHSEHDVIMEQGDIGASFCVLLAGSCDVRIRQQHDNPEELEGEHSSDLSSQDQNQNASMIQNSELSSTSGSLPEGNLDSEAAPSTVKHVSRRQGMMALGQDLQAMRTLHEDLEGDQEPAGGLSEKKPESDHRLHAARSLDTENYGNIRWGNDTEDLDRLYHKREWKYGSVVQEIHCGAAIGEAALMMKGSLRLATVVAKTPVDLMIIEKADYDAILKGSQQNDIEELVSWLRDIPLLRSLSMVNLMRLYYCCRSLTFHRNEVLVAEGAPSTGLYLIVSGECHLSVKRYPKERKEGSPRASVIDLAILGSTQFFGEESFFVKSKMVHDHHQEGNACWITIPEYRRHVFRMKSRKDHAIKIPDTTHPCTVVALTTMTVLFLNRRHAPARLGRDILNQLKKELNAKEHFRSKRIEQMECLKAMWEKESPGVHPDPSSRLLRRYEKEVWQDTRGVVDSLPTLTAVRKSDGVAMNRTMEQGTGHLEDLSCVDERGLTIKQALLRHSLDYEDQKLDLNRLEIGHDVGVLPSISTCVQCPKDMISHPCRSPSPHFWDHLLQPVKLLSGLFPPGLPSKVEVKLSHSPDANKFKLPSVGLRKGWSEIKHKKKLSSEHLLLVSTDIEREIRHLTDSECRKMLEETLYRDHLEAELNLALQALEGAVLESKIQNQLQQHDKLSPRTHASLMSTIHGACSGEYEDKIFKTEVPQEYFVEGHSIQREPVGLLMPKLCSPSTVAGNYQHGTPRGVENLLPPYCSPRDKTVDLSIPGRTLGSRSRKREV